jgi:hypothetical protein
MMADGCWNQATGGNAAEPDECRSIFSGVGRINLGVACTTPSEKEVQGCPEASFKKESEKMG